MIGRATGLLAHYRNVNWALADQAMVSGVNFLTSIMLARYLGLEEFGRFTLAWIMVLFLNAIQHAMIVSPMMSIGPKQTAEDEPAYYGAVAAQQIAFGLGVFMLVWGGAAAVAAIFPHWNIDGLALPLACATLGFQCQNFLRRYFFTRGRSAAALASDALRYVGQLTLLFWLFRTTEMDSAAALWVIAALAALGTLAVLPARERMEWRIETIRATAARHWHFSKWLTAAALMQWASGNLFVIAAGALLGDWAVGALNAAKRLMGVTHILYHGLENIVPAAAARLFHTGGSQALKTYLLRVTIYGELATGAVAAVMFVAPGFWLTLVFGDQYGEYGYLLRWYAGIYIVKFLNLPIRAGLRAIEQTSKIFWAFLWMTLFSLLAAYPLVEFLSLTGAMIGLTGTNLILVGVLYAGLLKQAAALSD